MDEHADHGDEGPGYDEPPGDERITSPMRNYTTGEVARGWAVLLVGLLLTFGVALALT